MVEGDQTGPTPGGPVRAAIVLVPAATSDTRCPPLLRLGGRRVLDRAGRVLAAAGVPRVLVATGPGVPRRLDDLIEHSPVLARYDPGRSLPPGHYLLVSGDQIFDTVAVRSITREPTVAALATDAELAVLDADLAAAVLADTVVSGAVTGGAGPGGTGTRTLHNRLAGQPGLTRRAAGGFTATVTDRHGSRLAEQALWRRYGPKPTDGLVCRYLNRPMSRPVTRLLLRTGIGPDPLTVVSFLVTLSAAALIGFGGRWWTLLLGGLLVQAGSTLDGIDGEVARISLRSSRRGALLDTILDRYADLALLVGLVFATGVSTAAWAWAFGAAAASMLIPYLNALVPSAPARLLRRDMRLLLCALSAALSVPFWGLVVVAVLGNLDAVRVFWSVVRRAPRAS